MLLIRPNKPILNLGNTLTNLRTSEKSYWRILNKVMNKCKVPKIPSLLVNNKFSSNCREKATSFTQLFSQQCSLVRNNCIFPNFSYYTNERISNMRLTTDCITPLTRSLNPNKATCSGGISSQMLLLCDETVVLPLNIIFSNILQTGIYPDIWKLVNVTHMFKEGDMRNS